MPIRGPDCLPFDSDDALRCRLPWLAGLDDPILAHRCRERAIHRLKPGEGEGAASW